MTQLIEKIDLIFRDLKNECITEKQAHQMVVKVINQHNQLCPNCKVNEEESNERPICPQCGVMYTLTELSIGRCLNCFPKEETP